MKDIFCESMLLNPTLPSMSLTQTFFSKRMLAAAETASGDCTVKSLGAENEKKETKSVASTFQCCAPFLALPGSLRFGLGPRLGTVSTGGPLLGLPQHDRKVRTALSLNVSVCPGCRDHSLDSVAGEQRRFIAYISGGWRSKV